MVTKATHYDKSPQATEQAGWHTLGGARALVDDDGEILLGCPGLEGENIDDITDESEESQDRREQKQEQAEASGWEPQRITDARATWQDAMEEAPPGMVPILKIGGTYYAFDEAAQALLDATQTGDGKTAEFDEEHYDHHIDALTKAGHQIAIAEEEEDGEAEIVDIEPDAERLEDHNAADSQPAIDKPGESADRGGNRDDRSDADAAGLDPGPGDTALPAAQGRPPIQPADPAGLPADAAMPPGAIGDLFKSLSSLRDVRKTGRITTDNLDRQYAQAIYDRLKDQEHSGDGFGEVYDLSDELGLGAIGYHSPGGMLAMIPPRFKQDNWEVRYAKPEIPGTASPAPAAIPSPPAPGQPGNRGDEAAHEGDPRDIREESIGDSIPDWLDDAGSEPKPDPQPKRRKISPTSKLGRAITDAVGDDPEDREGFADLLQEVYDIKREHVQEYNGALDELIGNFAGDLTGRKRLIGQLQQAQDPAHIAAFDEMVEMAENSYPILIQGVGDSEAGLNDPEYALFEAIKSGRKPVPAIHSDEIVGEALAYLDTVDRSGQAFQDDPGEDWDHGFYRRRRAQKIRYQAGQLSLWLRSKFSRWAMRKRLQSNARKLAKQFL